MTIDKSMMKRLVAQTFPHGGDKYFDYEEEFDALCHAIEAAVLPEGWVAVPKELSDTQWNDAIPMLHSDGKTPITREECDDIYCNLIAAAPKARRSEAGAEMTGMLEGNGVENVDKNDVPRRCEKAETRGVAKRESCLSMEGD